MNSRVGLARMFAALAFVALFGAARLEAATSVTLAWDASPDPNVVGYVISYGTVSHSYTKQVDVGSRTQFTLFSIPVGTYYFVVQSYSADQSTSDISNEVKA